jgi:hypothetical protein
MRERMTGGSFTGAIVIDMFNAAARPDMSLAVTVSISEPGYPGRYCSFPVSIVSMLSGPIVALSFFIPEMEKDSRSPA